MVNTVILWQTNYHYRFGQIPSDINRQIIGDLQDIHGDRQWPEQQYPLAIDRRYILPYPPVFIQSASSMPNN